MHLLAAMWLWAEPHWGHSGAVSAATGSGSLRCALHAIPQWGCEQQLCGYWCRPDWKPVGNFAQHGEMALAGPV